MVTIYEYLTSKAGNKPNAFCLLKPGFISHDKEFKLILIDNGWEIIEDGTKELTSKQAHDLYIPHKKEDFYEDLCKYMSSGKSHWYGCYKDCKKPIRAMLILKNKIRNKWGKDEMRNAMHSSDSPANVTRELNICKQ